MFRGASFKELRSYLPHAPETSHQIPTSINQSSSTRWITPGLSCTTTHVAVSGSSSAKVPDPSVKTSTCQVRPCRRMRLNVWTRFAGNTPSRTVSSRRRARKDVQGNSPLVCCTAVSPAPPTTRFHAGGWLSASNYRKIMLGDDEAKRPHLKKVYVGPTEILVHKNHIIRTCLMYHAACKVEFQPFTRSYSQLTFFNFL